MKGMGRVAYRLARMSPAEIAIPAVVVYELEFGALGCGDPARRRRELKRLTGAVSILAFDDRAADCAARLRYDLGQSDTAIGPMDLLIAATALAYGTKLVTHNTREFGRVPGLQVEDWF